MRLRLNSRRRSFAALRMRSQIRCWKLLRHASYAGALLLANACNSALAEGINVGVKPLNRSDIAYCLDASSIRATSDGWTLFQRRPCLDPSSGAAQEYRVQCTQPAGGPFAYE